jgi:hypothetical protein
MTWTYNIALPTARDKVRLYLGDTEQAAPQLQDEEIDAVLIDVPNAMLAAADLATFLAAKYARLVNTTNGNLTAALGDRQAHYEALARLLRARAARRSGAPLMPAMSVSAKDAAAENTDRVLPAFGRDMMRVLGEAPTSVPPVDANDPTWWMP